MTNHVTLTMTLRIWDATLFRQAAHDRALADGLEPEQAAEYLDPRQQDLGSCALMLIDPGTSPDGSQIDGTETECFSTGDDGDEEEEQDEEEDQGCEECARSNGPHYHGPCGH